MSHNFPSAFCKLLGSISHSHTLVPPTITIAFLTNVLQIRTSYKPKKSQQINPPELHTQETSCLSSNLRKLQTCQLLNYACNELVVLHRQIHRNLSPKWFRCRTKSTKWPIRIDLDYLIISPIEAHKRNSDETSPNSINQREKLLTSLESELQLVEDSSPSPHDTMAAQGEL
jgi:hypothetical protein